MVVNNFNLFPLSIIIPSDNRITRLYNTRRNLTSQVLLVYYVLLFEIYFIDSKIWTCGIGMDIREPFQRHNQKEAQGVRMRSPVNTDAIFPGNRYMASRKLALERFPLFLWPTDIAHLMPPPRVLILEDFPTLEHALELHSLWLWPTVGGTLYDTLREKVSNID